MNAEVDRLLVDGTTITIFGSVEPQFRPVLEAFIDNFRTRRELGASVAIYHQGKKVVDLWAGNMDEERTRPWEEHSIVTTASVMKGMMALALHMLADQGKLDYDAPVAQYWPEFAQGGKEKVTVRQAISHHAALHMNDHAQPGDYFRWDTMVDAIAMQKPEWEPGTKGVYHTISIIFILGKLIQSVSGEYPWDYFRREVTEKLGIEYHQRLTDAEMPLFGSDFDTAYFIQQANLAPEVMARFFAGMGDITSVLSGEEMAALPHLTAAGNARGLAKLFAFCAENGALDGVRIFSPQTIDLMTEPQWYAPCAVWGTPFHAALGLLVNDPEFFYIGPNPKAFGTAGGGGSFGFADRENRLSMGYALNRWWPALALGERSRTLVDAAYICV
jgi:CubicO group peptidase (beta-lactamase class C family)